MTRKATRNIIQIDENRCTGCGICAEGCPEGAIQVIDGKARLVGEILCDGLGACIGTCPEGAISVERREAEPYDERRVMDNVVSHGPNVIKAHLDHLDHHAQQEYMEIAIEYLKDHGLPVPEHRSKETQPSTSNGNACAGGGCPGSSAIDMRKAAADDGAGASSARVPVRSQLQNWPVQLALANPSAPYFKGADLLIAADCVPFAHGNFHQEFLKGKVLVMFCPKLDDDKIGMYLQKLETIFATQDIHSITLVHMQVMCCFGLRSLVEDALKGSGRKITVRDVIISAQGDVLPERNPHLKFY